MNQILTRHQFFYSAFMLTHQQQYKTFIKNGNMIISAYCPQKIYNHFQETLLWHDQEEDHLTSKSQEDHGDEVQLLNTFGFKMIKAVKEGLNENNFK